jgi:hypothetical protein
MLSQPAFDFADVTPRLTDLISPMSPPTAAPAIWLTLAVVSGA